MADVKGWRRVFGRDERTDELEALADRLVQDIRKQAALTAAAAKDLQKVIAVERKKVMGQ